MNRALGITLTAAVLFGGFATSQTAPKETARPLQSVAETSLQLRDTQGTLRAVLVGENGSAGLSTATLQKSGTWFASVHLNSSLSEVSEHYRNALAQLGFEGTAESVSETLMIWTLEKGGRQVSAVFNRGGDGVVANISWL